MPFSSSQRTQSLHQPAVNPTTAPFFMPSPPPIIMPSEPWLRGSHMQPPPVAQPSEHWIRGSHMQPPPVAQPFPMNAPQPQFHPHPISTPHPWIPPHSNNVSHLRDYVPLDGRPTRQQSQSSHIMQPSRARSQPPSKRTRPQPPDQPPIPSRYSTKSVAPPEEKVTNWCTRLKNLAEPLNMPMTHEKYQVDTRQGKMWKVKYFLNGEEFSESTGNNIKRTKQDAAFKAYSGLSRELERWR
ncbi:hypothetical protein DL96DRAFT_477496 [Flagelloscypha sp. PMI_526]|nr:hypothetical protein DL96DRAFT_477496 [Flagelloscypha sp. PMI_526]